MSQSKTPTTIKTITKFISGIGGLLFLNDLPISLGGTICVSGELRYTPKGVGPAAKCIRRIQGFMMHREADLSENRIKTSQIQPMVARHTLYIQISFHVFYCPLYHLVPTRRPQNTSTHWPGVGLQGETIGPDREASEDSRNKRRAEYPLVRKDG